MKCLWHHYHSDSVKGLALNQAYFAREEAWCPSGLRVLPFTLLILGARGGGGGGGSVAYARVVGLG